MSWGSTLERRRRADAPGLTRCGPCPHGTRHCPCEDGGTCRHTVVDGDVGLPCPRTGLIGCLVCT